MTTVNLTNNLHQCTQAYTQATKERQVMGDCQATTHRNPACRVPPGARQMKQAACSVANSKQTDEQKWRRRRPLVAATGTNSNHDDNDNDDDNNAVPGITELSSMLLLLLPRSLPLATGDGAMSTRDDDNDDALCLNYRL